MNARRLLVTGASGSGTTTLGMALAAHWAVPHADVDDYFWVPSEDPYTVKRDSRDRVRLMHEIFLPRPAWVLSGSVMGWGERIVDRLEGIVFLELDPGVRLKRLKSREYRRYGARIDPGGDRQSNHEEFMDWARRYDDQDFDGRSRRRHEEWLASLDCPLLRLDASDELALLVKFVRNWAGD
ncbi:AAA family ATPase [Nocardiopsis baichengensis]|uniref:AAA family ATPase n=1 Tax=Nocardiopsis baichengensis TaxID=280240 RepID=UPI000593649C|nr:AAA family ATPase [Nocardiopsis baichengensis]